MSDKKRYVYTRDSNRELYHIVEITEVPQGVIREYRADRVAEVWSEELAKNICVGLEVVTSHPERFGLNKIEPKDDDFYRGIRGD